MRSLSHLMQASATLACMATPIAAHEFWIDIGQLQPSVGEEITANLRVGQDLSGIALPYLDATTKAMTHVAPTSSNPLGARLGDRPVISGVTLLEDGLHILTVETHPAYIIFETLPKFEDYLAYEGQSKIATFHRERGLAETEIAEEYIRNARALLQIGPIDEGDADRPTGMPFEIVVAGTPFQTDQNVLSVQLEWQGNPAPGAQIALFHLPSDGSAPGGTLRALARTDQNGHAEFPLMGAGQYMLNAVRVEPVDGPGSVVWQSYWASTTFDIEAAQKQKARQ